MAAMIALPESNKNHDVEFQRDATLASSTKSSLDNVLPVTIECKGLVVNAKDVHILKKIDATFLPATTTALMGKSGAGKTTLLNVLSGRRSGYKVTYDDLLVNGQQMSAKRMQSISSLVPQDDILIAVLTPRESLMYAAMMSLTGNKAQLTAAVDDTLKVLSLEGCADTFNGDYDLKGISGGERKRTSIGLELITNPSCLFLDEPTSGLDSKVALDVVLLLQKLSQQGRNIVCTIHQPSVEIFSKFDRLVLLNDGEVVYQGSIRTVTDYFTGIGLPVPAAANPADHMLNVVSMGSPPKGYVSFVDAFQSSKYSEEYKQYQKDAVKTYQDKKVAFNPGEGKSANSIFHKFTVLTRRSAYVSLRDSKQVRTRIMQMVIMGAIVGLTYFQLPRKQTAIFDRQSSMLLVTAFTIMGSIMMTIHAVPMEKTMLKREYQNGYYPGGVFTFSRLLVFYLYQILYVTVYAVIVYNLVGFAPGFDHFLVFYGTLILGGCLAVTLGLFFGSLFPTVSQASAIVPTLVMPMMLFSGLLISPDNIPVYFIWIYYLSFLQYIFQVLVVNEFKDLEFRECSLDDRLTPGFCPLGSCSDDPQNISLPAEKCPGELVLNNAGYDLDEQWVNIAILFGYLSVMIILCYLGIRRFLRS